VAASPAAAGPRSGPCNSGPTKARCLIWNAKVDFVADGDTIDVDIGGDGSRRLQRVRLTGINTMEQTVYARDPSRRRGECHALEATARLNQLVRASRGRVRLYAQKATSRSGRRLRRAVSVRVGGRWRDAGALQLAGGHALWFPQEGEHAWNREYSVLAEQAAARGTGIWDPAHCAGGPPGRLRMWINWDAEGVDQRNVNGEWVKIKNLDPANPVSLRGWSLRDAFQLRRLEFPASATVPAGGSATVYVGDGPNSTTAFHWGFRAPLFPNVSDNGLYRGSAAYLFDPRGNIRAHMQYPCRWRCSDPLAGKVQIDAEPTRREEYVTLRNVSASPIELEGYRLASDFHGYAFGPGSTIGPGQTMRVMVNGDPADDTALEKHWGFNGSILTNSGGMVRLATFTDIDLACKSWGSGSC
jgi:endonuclease YncB( thermonuclease family)